MNGPAAPQSGERREPAPSSPKGLILLVEDNSALREMIAVFLKHDGYAVITAANGRDALESYLARAAEVALVISDLNLPDIDGLEIFAAIQARDQPPLFLMITGLVTPAVEARFHRAGISDYIAKPFGAAALCKQVAEMMRR